MADYVNTMSVRVWKNGTLSSSTVEIKKFSDGKSSDNTFKLDEFLTVTRGDNTTFTGIFRGTIFVDGTHYPVIEYYDFSESATFHYAIGLPAGSNVASQINSALNKSSFVVCFFPRTLIAIPGGECEVEELATGDLVLTGDSQVVPIKWIGRQTVSTRFGPAERLMPVRFFAGSLGGGGATSSAA